MFDNLNELIDFSKYCYKYITKNTNNIFANQCDIEQFKQFIIHLIK
jgi:hypothetical protein